MEDIPSQNVQDSYYYVKLEKNKVLSISEANTSVQPRTMVVHI